MGNSVEELFWIRFVFVGSLRGGGEVILRIGIFGFLVFNFNFFGDFGFRGGIGRVGGRGGRILYLFFFVLE